MNIIAKGASSLQVRAKPTELFVAQVSIFFLPRQLRNGDTTALQRFGSKPATLANAQWVIAQECGFQSWAKLKHEIEAGQRPNAKQYQTLAADFMAACNGDEQALLRVHNLFGSAFSQAGRALTPKQLRAKIEGIGDRKITLVSDLGGAFEKFNRC